MFIRGVMKRRSIIRQRIVRRRSPEVVPPLTIAGQLYVSGVVTSTMIGAFYGCHTAIPKRDYCEKIAASSLGLCCGFAFGVALPIIGPLMILQEGFQLIHDRSEPSK
jgi:hypothetical protein